MPPPCTQTRASCLLASTQARSGTHVGSAPCPRPVVPIRGSVGPVGVTDRRGRPHSRAKSRVLAPAYPVSCVLYGLRKCGTEQSDHCHLGQTPCAPGGRLRHSL